jgi:hypothetical protein
MGRHKMSQCRDFMVIKFGAGTVPAPNPPIVEKYTPNGASQIRQCYKRVSSYLG